MGRQKSRKRTAPAEDRAGVGPAAEPAAAGDPRRLAVAILLERFDRRVSLDTLLLRPAVTFLDERDQALLRELIGGVLRNRSLLDFYLQSLSHRPLARLDPVVLWILRVALYQLAFLRVPEYAAVNEAGRLCRRFRKGSAAAFVNALLRGFLRQRPAAPTGDSPEELAVRFSHPAWLVARYLARWGRERTLRILEQNNSPPEPVVWVNPFKLEREAFLRRLEARGIAAEAVAGLPHAVRVFSKGFVSDPLYREGCCFFMDPSSQRVGQLGEVSDCRLLGDLCSAPGGKSFVLAARMAPGARLVCADVHPGRLRQVRERAAFYGVTCQFYALADMVESAPFSAGFDYLLVDVPCSGLGTLRSNPDIRWSVSEGDLLRHQACQRSILGHAFALLGTGRELVYSTCSTEPEENEQVVDAFLAGEPAARRSAEDLCIVPNEAGGDGFFAARVRRV